MLSPDQLALLARAFAELGFWSGVAGAIAWRIVCDCWSLWCDKYLEWEERRQRITAARMRFMHGPALFPGIPSYIRRAVIRVKQRQPAHG